MLRSLKEIRGYQIAATDGPIGAADDFYLDDVGWFVRYVVVRAGSWLSERRVLVSPEAFGTPDWVSRSLPVRLSKARIQDSPPVATESTVSRHQEERLRAHYGWPNWWSTPLQGVTIPTSRELGDTKAREAALGVQEVEPHLRSANEILGYHIEAIGGDVGHVEDLIVDDDVWAIRYFVVDTKNILPGKKVIVSPHWVTEARWHDSKVAVALQKKQIEEAPKFDPHEPINRRYEERLYDFYGRPRYW